MIHSKKIIISTLASLAIFSGIAFPLASWHVKKVIDGDTFVAQRAGKEITIRVLGIDTPEVESPYRKAACYGYEASDEAKRILDGKNVMLFADSQAGDKDKYNRYLRYVFVGGKFYNAYMIEQGYAFNYPYGKSATIKYFNKLENTAREARVGLWGKQCDYFFENAK